MYYKFINIAIFLKTRNVSHNIFPEEERMKDWRVSPNIGLIPKVIPLRIIDNSRFRKSLEGLEIAKPATPILLTWTSQADLHAFLSSMKTSTQ